MTSTTERPAEAVRSPLRDRPQFTAVSSDPRTRTVHVDYAAPSAAASSAAGTVPMFVEVPPTALPTTPFTLDGATGPVTVTTVRTG